MWPNRVWNPGPLTYESDALQTVLHRPASSLINLISKDTNMVFKFIMNHKKIFKAQRVSQK